jgi:hypothetical protein
MCLNCSVPVCPGCALVRTPAPKTQSPSKKIAVPIRVKSTGAPARAYSPAGLSRCGSCAGCMLPNCKRCPYCRDMKRYGGEGRLRKACIKRICTFSVGVHKASAAVSKVMSPLAARGTTTTVIKSSTAASAASTGAVSGVTRIISTPSVGGSRSTPTGPQSRLATPTSSSVKKIQQWPPAPVITIDLDAPNFQSSPGPSAILAASNNASKESYPCTVCKRLFPTRIQMLAHRSVSHNKTNIVASVNRPVVLHHGGDQD